MNRSLDFQGNAAVNYTDRETPWMRIIEHKWFEFGKDENGNDLLKTIISREYSSEWKPGDEPYYPVNDEKNGGLYAAYKKMAEGEEVENTKCIRKHGNQLLWLESEFNNVLVEFLKEGVASDNAENVRRIVRT